MFDFITQDITLKDYPIATCIHWAQGILVGWLVAQAHWKAHWHLIGYAFLATACFLVYETLEQLRIGDRGDVDVLNFAVMVHIAAGVTCAFHAGRERWKRRRSDERKS